MPRRIIRANVDEQPRTGTANRLRYQTVVFLSRLNRSEEAHGEEELCLRAECSTKLSHRLTAAP